MDEVGTVAQGLGEDRPQLNDALTTPGIKRRARDASSTGLAQQQQQDVAAARRRSPPGPASREHQHALEALEFRVSGLGGSPTRSARIAVAEERRPADALLLAGQAERLVAGDVVWDDLFKDPAIEELRARASRGVAVPTRNFVPNPDSRARASGSAILERLHGAATTAAARTTAACTAPASTRPRRCPATRCSPTDSENTVTATTDLGFAVTVEDTGDSQEVQVKVTLTIQQSPTPIVQTKTIDLINPGEQKTVIFRNLGQVQFATRTTVKVDVQPVPGEKNTANNSEAVPGHLLARLALSSWQR